MHLVFLPLLPVWLLAAFACVALCLGAYAAIRGVRGSLLRSIAVFLLLGWLAGPHLSRPVLAPAPQDVLLVVDHSPSMALRDRLPHADTIADRIEAAAHRLPGLTLHRIVVPGGKGHGTRLFDAMDKADFPPGRFSGAILVTDGMVHDVPTGLPDRFTRDGRTLPLHVLLTGQGEETDRRIRVLQAPPYALVGKDAVLRVVVDDLGAQGQEAAALTLTQDGEPPRQITATPGVPLELHVPVRRPGEMLVSLAAGPLAGEVTTRNNWAIVRINGVRDRLKVLLVSGTPNQGERVWRRLLKADPSVDLVHFTILRPPDKDDGTPLSDLALIPFPVKELFQDRIRQFDLIILDGFRNAGILPQDYLANIADYVRGGGGLLLTAGPEFTADGTLQDTPLARVLPAHVPEDGIRTQKFAPALTEAGKRHPVTAKLSRPWGPWYRALAPDHVHGTPLLTGPDGAPLLVLDTVGKGRVALLLSDQLWLWSRGEGGGGPQAELLKNLSHWLMKEPDLEENQLHARLENGKLRIVRHSDSATLHDPADITAPDGAHRRLVLEPEGNGVFSGAIATGGQEGIWTVRQNGLMASAARIDPDALEDSDLRATASRLAPRAAESGGAVSWLGTPDATPALRQVDSGPTHGSGWIGFPRQTLPVSSASRLTALCPSWLALAGALVLFFLGWWREGKVRRG